MIKYLLDILHSEDWKDGDETIQFAKGKYKGVTYLQRFIQWLKK